MNKSIPEDVKHVIAHYPKPAYRYFVDMRKLVLRVAESIGIGDRLEETLKWNEPSYLAKGGSTIRMSWSEKRPDEFAFYFNCQSTLVETFRELYRDELEFDKNRAILLPLSGPLPADALHDCLRMAMQYHSLKKLPLLGG